MIWSLWHFRRVWFFICSYFCKTRTRKGLVKLLILKKKCTLNKKILRNTVKTPRSQAAVLVGFNILDINNNNTTLPNEFKMKERKGESKRPMFQKTICQLWTICQPSKYIFPLQASGVYLQGKNSLQLSTHISIQISIQNVEVFKLLFHQF